MPRVFTIDGVPGVQQDSQAPAVLGQAMGLIRVAALEGFRDAQEDVRKVLRDELLWVKVGVGFSAGVSLLVLIGALLRVGRRVP